jgi:hypothetical protein
MDVGTAIDQGRRAIVRLVAVACLSAAAAAEEPRFLVFHVDAVGSAELDRALREGRLPNLEAAFAGGGRLDAVTLYPQGTEVLYPRLKRGSRTDGPGPVGWGHFDREESRVASALEAQLELLRAMPRRALSTILYGVPSFQTMALWAMHNIPDLLERYGVVEFFWFATDSLGHWQGREAYVNSLEQFDAFLGEIMPRLDLDRLNLILYADHGMLFSDETVDLERLVAEVAGEQLLHYAFPNVYLHDPHESATVARRLVLEGVADFAFFRRAPGLVEGYFHGTFVSIEGTHDAVALVAEGDPFGYDALGYAGEPLSDDAWLMLTGRSAFPAVPPNVFHFLQHPDVGDVVLGLNPPRIPLTLIANRGNHVGLTQAEMVVPILLRGPELEPYYDLEMLWLHTLYERIPVLEFVKVPQRERHRLDIWLDLSTRTPSPAARLLLSPAYRWRVGVEGRSERLALWTEYDVYGSYLTRWWVGGGAAYRDQTFAPLLVVQTEFDVAEFGMVVKLDAGPATWGVGVSLSFAIADAARLTWHAPAGIGASYRW